MQIKTFIIDAFTNEAFKGNPAGVCLLDAPITESIMQSIASELNLSETAFLQQTTSGEQYNIRYFTPTVEIDFCGHATLASAKLVLDKLGKDKVEFTTRTQLKITANKEAEYLKMQFPIYQPVAYTPSDELLASFGITHPIATKYASELAMLLVEVKDKQTLLNISPNFPKALASSNTVKEVVVTTKSEEEAYDFYSRCFCPWLGINEDPVTGSVHSVLAKYWGDKLNKQELSAYQLSKRGGFLLLKILDNNSLEVRSNAQIVLEGMLNI